MEQQSPRRRRKKHRSMVPRIFLLVLIVFAVVFGVKWMFSGRTSVPEAARKLEKTQVPDWIDTQLIPVDGASRRGEKLEELNSIVIHYVGNPKTTAQQNRDFYTNKDAGVSSHFVVGLEGEVIQCVPLDEKSSASNWRNRDTISIETCHPDETGKFTEKTYASLVKLTAWLCKNSNLDETKVIRHYDITEKECPIYFVKNEDAWNTFLDDVKQELAELN